MSNEFQKRLYHFESNPPGTVWNKIVLALNQMPVAEEFPEKLYDLQIPPPPGVWQKISSALNKTSEPKIPVTFINRIKPYYRYAAAAILIGFITFFVSLFINKQNIANVAEKQSVPGVKPNTLSPQKIENLNTNKKQEAIVLTKPFPEPDKKQLLASSLTSEGRSLEELIQNKMINSFVEYSSPATLQTNYSADNFENDAEYLDYSSPAINYDQSRIRKINNYFVLLRPDGNIIRISRKFADMIGCMYTSASNSTNENCQEQINSWRKKMAKSLLTPSQDNFMDILTMIKSLQDN